MDLRDFSYLDCSRRAQLLRGEASKLSEDTWVLLDVGGRGKPHAPFINGRVRCHYVLDIERAETVDVVGDARQMPFTDGSIDVVLCTQVLEHVQEPVALIAEIRRILKPGGTLLLSVPGIFPQHGSSGDYWRYMPQGLEWLLRGFEHVDVRAEAGTLSSFFLVFNMYLFILSAWSPPTMKQQLGKLLRLPILRWNGVMHRLFGVNQGRQFGQELIVSGKGGNRPPLFDEKYR